MEVVSPGSVKSENYLRDYQEKRSEYALRGIPEYWLIDPSRNQVMILVLSDREDYEEQLYQGQLYEEQLYQGQERIISPLFPDLQLTAQQILEAK